MIFCPNNLITINNCSVNNEKSAFPLENMLSNVLIEKTFMDSYIDIDFGSDISIDTIGFIGDFNPLIYASSSPIYSSSDYLTTLSEILTFINQTYRYWTIANQILYFIQNYTSTGSDADLDQPNDDYNTASNFVPMTAFYMSTYHTFNVSLAGSGFEYMWTVLSSGSVAGTSIAFTGSTAGDSYGYVYFSSSGSSNWNVFASSTDNGLKTMTFPKNANGDTVGGFIKYYYHSDAWYYAFNGNNAIVIIAQNGSVYKSSLSPSNLVVRWDGQVGPAGSATPDVTTDSIRYASTTNYIDHLFLGNKLVFPDPRFGSIPNHINNDIENYSIGGQRYVTNGAQIKNQKFEFAHIMKSKYDEILAFAESTYRNNSGIFAQTEDDLDLFPPYFARMLLNFNKRTRETRYSFSANVREVK